MDVLCKDIFDFSNYYFRFIVTGTLSSNGYINYFIIVKLV